MHAIDLKTDAPSSLPGKVYSLTQSEQHTLQEFVKEHLEKGYICPSKSPYAVTPPPSSSSKRRMTNYDRSRTIEK
jgi:hypothetical protein